MCDRHCGLAAAAEDAAPPVGEVHQVLCDDDELASARLGLVEATQKVLARGLDILGIGAPDAM